MLDGAGASTFLDLIDDRNQDKFLQKNSKKLTKFSENKVDDKSKIIPFDQVTRDQKRNERKQVVFIDSQVQDYQTLIDAFNEDTEVYLIQSSEDGFKKIDKVLNKNCDVSSLHIIGHGSAGKILFGNATLSNDTIQSYNQTLRSIGQCLTDDGDILFYGCNVASTEGGKTLISKISEITKADIAASDDVTGKSGDWELEIKVGHIDTKNINQTDYQHNLAMYRTATKSSNAASVTVGVDGITSIRGAMAAFTGTADRNAYDFKSSRDHNPSDSDLWQDHYITYNSGTFGSGDTSDANEVDRFTVVLEKTGITSGSLTARRPDSPSSGNIGEATWKGSTYDVDINTTDSADYKLQATRSSDDADEGPMDVYMVALDSHFGNNSDRHNKIAEVVFDREIIGILIDGDQTVTASSNTGNVDLHNSNNSTYPDPLNNSNRSFETIKWRSFQNSGGSYWGYGNAASSKNGDWFAVGGTDNRTLHVAAKNTGGGDYARILVKGEVANNAPVAQNDVGVVNEDATLTVANSSNSNVSGSFDANGEHSGDIMDTSSGSHSDSDADSDAIEVTHIQHSSAGSATAVGDYTYSHGSATSVTGTYGTLTIGSDGSYEYVADQSAADDLDSGDSVTDVFTYTLSDGTATDTATLTITVLGVNDAPVAQNDVGYIQEGKTLTVSDGDNANVSGSYDATGEHSGDVINTSSGSHSDSDADDSASLSVASFRTGGTEGSGTAGTLGEALSGTYGTLTMNANGSYTYVSTANSVSGTVTDVFNYTVSDGTATDTATLTITIYNSNDPVAANNTGTINEDATLSVSDGASANNITTAALSTGTPLDISDEETVATGLKFNPDGTKMFIVGINGDEINEYTLSTAWDVSSASHDRALSISAKDTAPQGVTFNSDGTKIYVVGAINDNIDSWELSTPYSLAGVDATDDHIATTDLGSNFNPRDIKFNNDGSKMFVLDTDGDTVAEYSLSTAYDPASKGSATEQSVSDAGDWLQGMGFNADGTRMFLVSSDDDDIHEFKLSTAWDISSETYVGNYAVTYPGSYNITAMAFSHDGTKMFHNDYSQGEVEQHTLVSPFNLVENVTGEHDGDILGDDTDANSDTLTVASYRTGSSEGSGTAAGSVGSALTGTYGQLTLNANGSYTYVANQSAADDLDAGDVVTDSFNYTVSDGNGGTDTGVIEITVIGINDTPAGVNDTDSVNVDETVTRSSGSSLLVADDTDVDDHDTLTVTVIQPSGGSASSVALHSSYNSSGTSVTGTYGTLTIGADGSYTYVADQDAADDIGSGSSETDVFTYTVWDGATTDTATLTITISGTEDTTTTAIKETKKERKEAKKQKKELKKERKKLKKAKRLLLKEFKLAKSSINRSAEFNQGLKLVDLVAESGSIDIKEGTEDINKLKTNFTDKSLKVKFKVFNDEGKEVQKYYGEMIDGSSLPEWIEVDPKTGKTKINIPKGEKLVEFKIIAVDVDNNKKQVTVVIDPEKIAKDKEILKESRKIAKGKITVNKDGSIKLKSVNKDGSVNKTTTDAINENKDFEDVVKKIKPNEFLKLKPNLRNNDFVVELSDEIKTNFKSLKVVLKDGKEIPNWIKLNPISGEIIANPPENMEKIELKVIIENENGELTVKDIEINFSDASPKTTEKLLNNDTMFIPLSDQLLKEQNILDNYGSQIINNL